MCPHDVYDWWVEKYGRNLQAFWPVVDTEIGRLGIMMANEGSYPENARALALNGAEVVYRASYPPRDRQRVLRDPEPGPGAGQQHVRGRAEHGDVLPLPRGDHADRHLRRPVLHHRLQGTDRRRQDYGAGSTYVAGPVDIEALRHHRGSAQWDNWLKDVRAELYGMLYEKPIYPKNLYLKRAPMKHAEYRQKVIKRQIRLMHERGSGRSRARDPIRVPVARREPPALSGGARRGARPWPPGVRSSGGSPSTCRRGAG